MTYTEKLILLNRKMEAVTLDILKFRQSNKYGDSHFINAGEANLATLERNFKALLANPLAKVDI